MTDHYSLSMLAWDRYPVRTCRSLHHCEVCDKDITYGQRYRDGGFSRRAHDACILPVSSPEASPSPRIGDVNHG